MPTYNIEALLNASAGAVSGTLVDAGMSRPFSGEYEYREANNDNILVWRKGRSPSTGVLMHKTIELSPELLCFLGMYSGDGNKTGQIGFAQRNIELLEAACAGLHIFFPDSVTLSVNLLNDSRYYMRPEFEPLVRAAGINQEGIPDINARNIPDSLRDHFKSEFIAEVQGCKHLQSIEQISVTLSPLKGARLAGGESREYIVNVSNSRSLLPIFLRVIEDINETLTEDSQYANHSGVVVLDWGAAPSQISFYAVNLYDFLRTSDTARWYTNSNQERRYKFEELDNDTLHVNGNFMVLKNITLGPLTSFGGGLYLAEGTTSKEVLLHFNEPEYKGASTALSFNSSENTSLSIFLKSLNECLGIPGQAITSWKVKVGSQYMYEMQVIGEMAQAPMVRKGAKGQGKSKSAVQAGMACEWAIKEFPDLAPVADKFSHIEYTGAGVPRVQINCSSSPSKLVFGLYRASSGSLLM